MSYGFPFQMPPAVNRIIKRPLTEIERGFAAESYRSLQKKLRSLSIIPLFLFIISTSLLSSLTIGSIISPVFMLATIIVGLVVFRNSVRILQFRKKISDVLKDGTAIEVQGPAHRNRTARNVQSFAVGPISLIVTPEVSGRVQEGAQVCVLCIPKLKAALSINNIALVRSARIICPPNLEAMAEPTYPAAQQPMYPAAPAPVQPHYQQQPYQQAQTFARLDNMPKTYPTAPRTVLNQTVPQPVGYPQQVLGPAYSQPNQQPSMNCAACGQIIPRDASACPYCSHDYQSTQTPPKRSDEMKSEPLPLPPPPPDSESEVMQAKPLIGVTLVQSPYPQEKQPIESILPTDVACPYCENKMVFTNRYSSYYCEKCKTYPWRCKSCKHTMSTSLDHCPKCGAARTGVNLSKMGL